MSAKGKGKRKVCRRAKQGEARRAVRAVTLAYVVPCLPLDGAVRQQRPALALHRVVRVLVQHDEVLVVLQAVHAVYVTVCGTFVALSKTAKAALRNAVER